MKKRFKVVAMSVAAVGMGAGILSQPVQAVSITDGDRIGTTEISSALADYATGLANWCSTAASNPIRGGSAYMTDLMTALCGATKP